ncbi:hypothetical protein ACOMHN_048795 [Nucella lapillus]
MASEKKPSVYTSSNSHGLKTVLDQLSSTERRLRSIVSGLQHHLSPKDSDLTVIIPVLFEKLRGEVLSVQKENASLKKHLEETESQVHELEDEVEDLKKALQKEGEARNDRQQKRMKGSLRILGLKGDGEGEVGESKLECLEKVMSLLHDKLQLASIRPSDISTVQRFGGPGDDPAGPIIIRFRDRNLKVRVLLKRRLLKGTGILIVEDLTHLNMTRLLKVKSHPNVKACWTRDGKILALRKDDRKVVVRQGNMSVLREEACAQRYPPVFCISSSSNSDQSSDSNSSDSSSDSETSSVTRCTKRRYRSHRSPATSRYSNSDSHSDSSPDLSCPKYRHHHAHNPHPSSGWNPGRGSYRPPRRGYYPGNRFQRGRRPFNFRYRGWRRPYGGWFQSNYRPRYHGEEGQRSRSRDDSRTSAELSRASHR